MIWLAVECSRLLADDSMRGYDEQLFFAAEKALKLHTLKGKEY
jgi:hypothetical protein